jgi:hypothetical protein
VLRSPSSEVPLQARSCTPPPFLTGGRLRHRLEVALRRSSLIVGMAKDPPPLPSLLCSQVEDGVGVHILHLRSGGGSTRPPGATTTGVRSTSAGPLLAPLAFAAVRWRSALRYGGILCEHFYLWWTTSGGEARTYGGGRGPHLR